MIGSDYVEKSASEFNDVMIFSDVANRIEKMLSVCVEDTHGEISLTIINGEVINMTTTTVRDGI
jgi:hypothetical protein